MKNSSIGPKKPLPVELYMKQSKNIRVLKTVLLPEACTVATSPLVLRWMGDSPRTDCAWRTTPTYKWHEQAIIKLSWCVSSVDTNMWMTERNNQHTQRVIVACDHYCCLLPQCKALRTCRLGFPIATAHCQTHAELFCNIMLHGKRHILKLKSFAFAF